MTYANLAFKTAAHQVPVRPGMVAIKLVAGNRAAPPIEVPAAEAAAIIADRGTKYFDWHDGIFARFLGESVTTGPSTPGHELDLARQALALAAVQDWGGAIHERTVVTVHLEVNGAGRWVGKVTLQNFQPGPIAEPPKPVPPEVEPGGVLVRFRLSGRPIGEIRARPGEIAAARRRFENCLTGGVVLVPGMGDPDEIATTLAGGIAEFRQFDERRHDLLGAVGWLASKAAGARGTSISEGGCGIEIDLARDGQTYWLQSISPFEVRVRGAPEPEPEPEPDDAAAHPQANDPEPVYKQCTICGVQFTPSRAHAETCSPACRQKRYRHRKNERTPCS